MQDDSSPLERLQRVGIVFVVLGGLACVVFITAKHGTTARISRLEDQVDVLSQRIDALEVPSDLEHAETEERDLASEISDIRMKLQEASVALANARVAERTRSRVQDVSLLVYVAFISVGSALLALGAARRRARVKTESPVANQR